MTELNVLEPVAGSFRDPSGQVVRQGNTLYRLVRASYQSSYQQLMDSGLYKHLVEQGLLIPHEEVDLASFSGTVGPDVCRIVKPDVVPFISYPYEWCFSQLKDAALATLALQIQALPFGMSLKDASAYNIQFRQGRPLLIDTLSFEPYDPSRPWIAYRQFCQHFLGPLLLMAHRDLRLNRLSQVHLDGIPLDLTSRLLPWNTYAQWGPLVHIHLHCRTHQQSIASDKPSRNQIFSEFKMRALLDSLQSCIQQIHLPKAIHTTWSRYYDTLHYSSTAFEHKNALVKAFIETVQPKSLWDLGANNGHLSRLASAHAIETVSMDSDPLAVEINYLKVKQEREKHLLPLWQDLTNPSGRIGWNNIERSALSDRGPADMVMLLAFVHHLAIANHVPWDYLVDFLAPLGRHLIVEFVPKSDPQVQALLAHRPHGFEQYTQSVFEAAFSRRFLIQQVSAINDSPRSLYLFERKD